MSSLQLPYARMPLTPGRTRPCLNLIENVITPRHWKLNEWILFSGTLPMNGPAFQPTNECVSSSKPTGTPTNPLTFNRGPTLWIRPSYVNQSVLATDVSIKRNCPVTHHFACHVVIVDKLTIKGPHVPDVLGTPHGIQFQTREPSANDQPPRRMTSELVWNSASKSSLVGSSTQSLTRT